MSSQRHQPDGRLILWGGIATFMVVMGIGRFVYTPILPDMIASRLLDVKSAGLLASSNFLGYFVGALAAALFRRATVRRQALIVSLVLSVLTTAAMGLTQSPLLWHLLRFASGVVSALALIFITGFVMEAFAARNRTHWIGWVFGGVGLGIAASSIVIELLQKAGVNWDGQWLAAGGLAALLAVPAIATALSLQPVDGVPASGTAAPPRVRLFTLGFTLLFVAYGGLGFGYVVQATYLPTLVRALPPLAGFSTLTWLVVGLAAAPSNLAWQIAGQRLGVVRALILAFLLQSGGLLVPVLWHSVPGAMIGAVALGATLIGITSLCLQQTRLMAGEQLARAIALMTASFGLGQIAGPPLAALLVGPGNDFLPPTIMASSVLALSALLLIPLLRKPRGEAG